VIRLGPQAALPNLRVSTVWLEIIWHQSVVVPDEKTPAFLAITCDLRWPAMLLVCDADEKTQRDLIFERTWYMDGVQVQRTFSDYNGSHLELRIDHPWYRPAVLDGAMRYEIMFYGGHSLSSSGYWREDLNWLWLLYGAIAAVIASALLDGWHTTAPPSRPPEPDTDRRERRP
jgi:hypothetical protein